MIELKLNSLINTNMDFVLRLFTACILGCVIGYERKNREKDAGMRTHAIVCVGACLFMIISKYGFYDTSNYDASRIAAQVVTGIGFLGAGIIFVKDNIVNGLTTAAGIWATSGVGMALGAELYFIGICSCILLLLIQGLLHNISILSNEPVKGIIKVTTLYSDSANIDEDIISILKMYNIKYSDIKYSKINNELILVLYVYYPLKFNKKILFYQLMKDKRILEISE